MLKKLVKFGNSNALVLDKTLMSLLSLKEDSLVKLRVEGEKLIISAPSDIESPVEKLKALTSNPCNTETENDLSSRFREKFLEETANDLNANDLPGGQRFEKGKEQFKNFFLEHGETFSNPEYVKRTQEITEKFQKKYLAKEINAKEYLSLLTEKINEVNKDFPEIEKMTENLKKVSEKIYKKNNE